MSVHLTWSISPHVSARRPCFAISSGGGTGGKDWRDYGVGKYEKCSNCMLHRGFEGTAAADAMRRPVEFLKVALGGVKTEGPMVTDVDLSKARKSVDVHSQPIDREMERIKVVALEGFRRTTRA